RARGASARAAPPLRSDPGRACLASMPRAPPTRLPTASCSCVTPSAEHTRPAQEGHTPRDLQEKGTSTSARQVRQASRAKPLGEHAAGEVTGEVPPDEARQPAPVRRAGEKARAVDAASVEPANRVLATEQPQRELTSHSPLMDGGWRPTRIGE